MNLSSFQIDGYYINDIIHEGLKSLVFRGQRLCDRKSVILKLLRSEYPSFNELVQFRHQYTVTQNSNIPGVVQPLGLEKYRNSLVLVMPDEGFISVDDYLKNHTLELKHCLKIGIKLAQIFQGLYNNRIIHKDIKPANILIHPKTLEIQLIDFSIASLLPKETQTIYHPNVLEGTLAYISPEQTGRMNRGIDYRSDFYSLGVTLYELLTGKLPFDATDAMELVHCHIAKMPKALGNTSTGSVHCREPIDRTSATLSRTLKAAQGTYRQDFGYPQSNAQGSAGNRENTPEVICNIVMKLMAKNAEDRYQSAWGIKKDLETCLNQLETRGQIESFEIGSQDICSHFNIPEKLYGRQYQVQQLLEAFNRVSGSQRKEVAEKKNLASVGFHDRHEPFLDREKKSSILNQDKTEKSASEMMLVAGYSGVGKTAVVNEVHKPIVRQRGYFIKGKFDQFQRNIPFSAFVQALRDLMGQLLSENNAQLQQWKEQILEAVRENGQVIIEVIPELEKIIGKQPPVTELSGTAAQNRFNLLFQNFIQVFTAKEHPLVIFLDDLQWADSASLNLLKLLISEVDSSYLLLIGAYRDNEVNPAHPLMLTLDEIQKKSAIFNTITLSPLRQYDLNQLVADTLHCSLQKALPLTQAIFKKTKGNPFFATQFLKALQVDGLIYFNLEEGLWQCDLAQVKLAAISEDVVEFVGKRLHKLNPVTQDALKLAACIGNQFELETLAIIRQTSELETATDLWVALKEGLILPTTEIYKFYTAETKDTPPNPTGNHLSASYKFLHDRIQQAAYSLIPENQKKETHLKIGQLLLKNTAESERDEKIFEIVNQLNYGVELITNKIQKHELAELNFLAGRKAKNATAYEAAIQYLETGLKILGDQSWDENYQLSFNLLTALIEAEYLNGNLNQARQLSETALKHAKTLLDRVKIYELQILFFITQNAMNNAIDLALEVLKLLGIDLPQEPEEITKAVEMLQGETQLNVEQISNLAKQPEITDPHQFAAIRILTNATSASYIANPRILPLIILTTVKLCMRYGNSALAASAYTWYGALLCGFSLEIETGYQFGKLSILILDRFQAPELIAKVSNMFNVFIRPWKEHIAETNIALADAIQAGLENGDIEYAFYAAVHRCNYYFFAGNNLQSVQEMQSQYAFAIHHAKFEFHEAFIRIGQQTVANLLGQSEDASQLVGEYLDESISLPTWLENSIVFLVLCTYSAKTMLLYLFGKYTEAIEAGKLGKQYEQAAAGTLYVSQHSFYYSLALLGQLDHRQCSILEKNLEQVEENQKITGIWASQCPVNYQHQYDLVEAEKHRVLGQKLEAMELYDKAIAGAKDNKYLQEEALANELAAKFYLGLGREKVAQSYMIEAYYCYSHWGAKAKVQDLEQCYPILLSPILEQQKINQTPLKTLASLGEMTNQLHTTVSTNTTGISETLDFNSVIKASQALSSEIDLEQLISQLMQVMMENAGATKGVLLLSQGSQLIVKAISNQNSDHEETVFVIKKSMFVEDSLDIPLSIINAVKRSLEILNIENVLNQTQFLSDPYLMQQQTQSLLCLPLCDRKQLLGILYLENNLATGAFTDERIEVLKLLCSQAAISIENAQLYQQSQDYAQQLEQSFKELQSAQVQLVQSEKMSALGQMMAGIAHEINNPVGFIGGNITHAEEYLKDLIEHLQLYQQHCLGLYPDITDHAEEIDLEYLLEDLPELISSMKTGVHRIRNISTSMRTFSRADQAQKVEFNLHEGIDSTLLILKHRLKANETRPDIELIKDYGNLPQVMCFPGQLNQVFMNLLANAIDVFDQSSENQSFEEIQAHPYQIKISTEVTEDQKQAIVKIKDNGSGMPETVKTKIFDHLFTTKPVGKGTGLGLSISRQIVEEKHGGHLSCYSQVGEGTEFVIEIPIH